MNPQKKENILLENTVDTNNELTTLTFNKVNLENLIKRTKSDPNLMIQMITLYLEQTPPLVLAMNKNLEDKNLVQIKSAVHKMIPSIFIMGIDAQAEVIARKIQNYELINQHESLEALVKQLGQISTQACIELAEKLDDLKNSGL